MSRFALDLGRDGADQLSHRLRDVGVLGDDHNGAHRDAFRPGSPPRWVEWLILGRSRLGFKAKDLSEMTFACLKLIIRDMVPPLVIAGAAEMPRRAAHGPFKRLGKRFRPLEPHGVSNFFDALF